MSSYPMIMYSQPVMRQRRVPMRGGSFLGDVGNAFGFVKKNKLISKGLTTAAPFAGQYSPIVGAAGTIAGLLGFGMAPKRRRTRKKAVKGKGKTKARKRRPARK